MNVHCSLDSNLNFIFLSLPKTKIITVHSQQFTYLFPFYHFKAADSYVFNLSWVLFRSGAEVLSWEFFLCLSSELDCPFLPSTPPFGFTPPRFPEENSLVIIMHKKPIYDSLHPWKCLYSTLTLVNSMSWYGLQGRKYGIFFLNFEGIMPTSFKRWSCLSGVVQLVECCSMHQAFA